ncbi:hypothetical protein C8Q75DRAFT_849295 [Abortiporus biennis]|nr:hypothetical protein C8Q75DRAFT_849295 [Abortiporus biennis]
MPRLGSSVDSHYPSSTESLLEPPHGSQRVKYRGAGARSLYDFCLETERQPIDVSLVMPHYRAKNQPLEHRLSMHVGTTHHPIKVKVCRNFTPARPTKFRLELHSSEDADITVWLPSDFKGHIHRSSACKRVSFSAGFTNRIMQNVYLTQSRRPSVVSVSENEKNAAMTRYADIYISDAADRNPYQQEKWTVGSSPDEDEVFVHTTGTVTFRMWDVHTGEPEAKCREACKRMFGLGWCAKRSPEHSSDWDFLLED